jgi:predicted Zn-dependent protease
MAPELLFLSVNSTDADGRSAAGARKEPPSLGVRMRRFLVAAALTGTLAGCGVSTQQEVEMGAQYANQIAQELPLVRDPEINRYINVLGDSIARVSDDRGLDWHFFVVDSREVNAFAVPGGYIYMNRGLIERAEDMSQVAGVLGHEIGHVTRRHSVQQMQSQQKANVGLTLVCVLTPNVCNNQAAGAAINLAGGALFAKFSREDEAEADQSGVQFLVRAGIDPRGIPAMFEILMEERRARPGGVDAWFATHPLEEDRVEATRAQIAKIPPAQLRGLATDTRAFQAFKQRLRSLPAPPAPRTR